jgi:hypothetical protein
VIKFDQMEGLTLVNRFLLEKLIVSELFRKALIFMEAKELSSDFARAHCWAFT